MKYFSIILLVLISLNFIVPSKEQRITTIQLDGVQYFVSRMNPYSPELNFYLSYQYCRSLGLQLASFETREKADSIAQYLSNAGYTKYDFWTSGNKLGTDMFLWMSTGLPFNATFNYLKHDETAAQPSDVINSNTAPQRTARESSDSGSSTGCISLKAPSFEWSTDDCTAIKDFICEQTRCYYYNYGSIPVSSAQGIKPVFLEKKPENKRKPSTTSEKTPENLETEKTITIKDILRNPKVPAGRKSMEKFDSDLQATTSSIITENSDETIANNVSVTSVNDTPAEMRDAEEAPIKKQNSVDVYIDKFFDFLNIKLTTEAPEEVEPEVEAAEPETETEKSYIEKLIDYYNLGLSTERPEKLGNEQENSENGTIFEKLIDFLNTEKVNTSLDIDAIPGYHDIKKLFEDTYTHKVPENTDDAVESENEETTKKSIFEEFIDLYNTKSHDIQAILDESYVQKPSEKQNTETSEPEEETSTHKSVLQELFDLYNNGRSLEEKNNNSNQNQIIALILEKVNRGKSIDVADFKKIPELQHIKKIAEDVYLEKVQEKVTEKPIDVTEKPARIDGVFKGLEAHLELPENIAKRSTQRQAKYLEVSPQPYLDIFATVGPYDNDGQMQDEPIANSPDNPEDNYVSTISPEYITTFKTISYT